MIEELTGIPVKTSPYVPEDKILRTPEAIHIHGRISLRGKMRRKHGRGRPAPRQLKVKKVFYAPMLEKLKAASS